MGKFGLLLYLDGSRAGRSVGSLPGTLSKERLHKEGRPARNGHPNFPASLLVAPFASPHPVSPRSLLRLLPPVEAGPGTPKESPLPTPVPGVVGRGTLLPSMVRSPVPLVAGPPVAPVVPVLSPVAGRRSVVLLLVISTAIPTLSLMLPASRRRSPLGHSHRDPMLALARLA